MKIQHFEKWSDVGTTIGRSSKTDLNNNIERFATTCTLQSLRISRTNGKQQRPTSQLATKV